jgi:hypothetical protein
MSRFYPGICLETEENHEDLNQGSRYPDRNSKRVPLQYKPTVLSIHRS